MQTNTPQSAVELGQVQSAPLAARSWNVVFDGEVIGSVHGETERQARDIIAILRMPNVTIQAAE